MCVCVWVCVRERGERQGEGSRGGLTCRTSGSSEAFSTEDLPDDKTEVDQSESRT